MPPRVVKKLLGMLLVSADVWSMDTLGRKWIYCLLVVSIAFKLNWVD